MASWLLTSLIAGLGTLSLGSPPFYVDPAFETGIDPGADVDSAAVWVDRRSPERSLLFVTSKEHDRIEVWYAATGLPYEPKPFLGGELNSTEPGQFNRPNAVWVLYDVPLGGSFKDILLTTEQLNGRIQVFGLPELAYLSSFGVGDIGRGHGLAAYEDGSRFYVFVTDSAAVDDRKVKKYRLLEADGGIGGELLRAFGEKEGPGLLYGGVESILADPAYNRLHVCGDEAPGRPDVIVYDLDGNYTGTNYGDADFEYDQEGIALYDTGGDRGYLIISDQYLRQPNEFEVLDRVTLSSLGHFESPAGAATITRNTDGVYLCQMPLPGFPNGLFYAVNDDKNVHAYDWTLVAETMGLEIVALDRPFRLERALSSAAGAGGQRALWHEDGSWWGALSHGAGLDQGGGPGSSEGLGIFRLEDGTFALKTRVDASSPEVVAAALGPGELLLLACVESDPSDLGLGAQLDGAQLDGAQLHRIHLYRFAYRASTRQHVLLDGPLVLETEASTGAALDCDARGRAWAAYVRGEELRAKWSEEDDRSSWDAAGVALGPASAVLPEILRVGGGLAVIWADAQGPRARIRRDGDPPGAWSGSESFGDGPVGSVTGVEAGGTIVAAFAHGAGGGSVWARAAGGGWAEREALPASATSPSLSVDRDSGGLHLFYLDSRSGLPQVLMRSAAGGQAFGPERRAIGWPGVVCGPILSAGTAPAEAADLVVAAGGSDGSGRFARLLLPSSVDQAPPITLGHDPPPERGYALEGAPLSFRITDDRSGVDRSSLRVSVDGSVAAAGAVSVRGVARNLLVTVPLAKEAGSSVSVRIEASDLADPPNVMVPFEYAFTIVGSQDEIFSRGDANADGDIDVADAIFTLLHLFLGKAAPPCSRSADSNDDGALDVSDPVRTLRFIFLGEPPPPPPFPGCGADPSPDGIPCGAFPPCR